MTHVDQTRNAEAPAHDGHVEVVTEPRLPGRIGRKRDQTRDADILDAALQVLAETGYEGMTMDMVAERARAGKATVYRRWPSKAELVLDGVAHLDSGAADPDQLPDTGTLRGDLVAMIGPSSLVEEEHKLKVMAGLVSTMSHGPQFAAAANAAIVEPWVVANRVLIQHAVERGEIDAPADIATVSHIIPSMAAYRVFIQREPLDRDFLLSLIDVVLLPALHPAPTSPFSLSSWANAPRNHQPRSKELTVTISAVTHLNLRGNAREALTFYQSVFGGDLTVVTYQDLHNVQDPSEADQVMWGQVTADNGFHVMAFDVPSSRPWNPGQDPFFVALRGTDTEEISAHWDKLSDGAAILVPLAPAQWGPLYGMLKDRFGITWVVDVAAEHNPS